MSARNLAEALRALVPLVPFDGNHADVMAKGKQLQAARDALREHEEAEPFADAIALAEAKRDTADTPALREFWHRLAGSIRKASTM